MPRLLDTFMLLFKSFNTVSVVVLNRPLPLNGRSPIIAFVSCCRLVSSKVSKAHHCLGKQIQDTFRKGE